jgi:hypothetical protein
LARLSQSFSGNPPSATAKILWRLHAYRIPLGGPLIISLLLLLAPRALPQNSTQSDSLRPDPEPRRGPRSAPAGQLPPFENLAQYGCQIDPALRDPAASGTGRPGYLLHVWATHRSVRTSADGGDPLATVPPGRDEALVNGDPPKPSTKSAQVDRPQRGDWSLLYSVRKDRKTAMRDCDTWMKGIEKALHAETSAKSPAR